MTSPSPFVLDPRLAADTIDVAQLDLCDLRLMNDRRFPWLILVPRVANMRELIDLAADEQQVLWAEVNRCSRLLQRVCQPHKLNVAALGNVVAQLHVHVIARFVDDAAWPAPVWGRGVAEPYANDARDALLEQLRAGLINA